MNTNRFTAIIVGLLFIIGTVAGVLSVVVTGPVLNDPNYLVKISTSQNQMVIGALLVLLMGLALAMVPVMMFPIFKKQNEIFALGYLVFRGALETVTYFVTVISFLLLVPLSQEIIKAGAVDSVQLLALDGLLRKTTEIGSSLTAIIFPLGAIMYYAVMYQSKLLPRWLSVWGLIGVLLHFITAGPISLFGFTNQMLAIQDIAALPIFVQELVMAIWLILKGFNLPTMAAAASRGSYSPVVNRETV